MPDNRHEGHSEVSNMLRGYSKFLDVLEKVEKAILAVTVGIMVIIIAYQVIMRYIFAHANSWSEELARYLFIYDVMIGAAIAIRRNSHLQIDILINLMKPKVRTILTIIATLAGMVFMVFLLSYSITLVQTGARTMSAGLGIPMSIPYSCMPVGIVLMLLTSIEVLFKNISALRGRKGGPGMNAGLLIIILLLGLALLGFPIYIALGIGALAALNLADLPLIVLPQRMFAGMNGSALLAIPFFILAGNIMSRSITGKLIDICNAIIGHIKGSLSLVTILASALFGAISGSGVATASAIGGITIPAMKREGYPAPFAVGVASISSILGPIIPPSIVLIVYASITNVSVAELFLGSVLPGIILAVALIAYGLYYGHKHNLPAHEKPNLRKIGSSVRKGIWALLMPIIILGGIFGGIFTPTEASAVAVVYSLIISLFVYKDMSFKELPQVFVEGAVSTATIMVMVGLSSASSYVITTSGLPQQLVSFFSSITNSPVVILLLLNILFLIIGMLMEANAAVVMMTPILLPLLNAFGIDLLQFGIVMSFNLCIGLVTPPVGLCLLLCNQTGETRLSHSLKAMMPMLLISIIVLFLITYVSPLTTLLPSIMAG